MKKKCKTDSVHYSVTGFICTTIAELLFARDPKEMELLATRVQGLVLLCKHREKQKVQKY
uniref:Uncharacterized protein n=1 Tax=Setaria italica TaxID=4555 RepID=K3ZYW5_SETIT